MPAHCRRRAVYLPAKALHYGRNRTNPINCARRHQFRSELCGFRPNRPRDELRPPVAHNATGADYREGSARFYVPNILRKSGLLMAAQHNCTATRRVRDSLLQFVNLFARRGIAGTLDGGWNVTRNPVFTQAVSKNLRCVSTTFRSTRNVINRAQRKK